jgi:hypothetical protein
VRSRASLFLSLSRSPRKFFLCDDSESFAKFSAHLARKCCPITTPVPSLIIGSQALKEVLVIIINNNNDNNDNNAIVFFFAPLFTRCAREERERERERTQSNDNGKRREEENKRFDS